MLLKILIGLAVVIAILLTVIALQPGKFRVERSAILAASPAALYDQVNDHRKFAVWNPWAKMDPTVVNTYSGPDAGVGAKCAWDGKKIGAGCATIIESKPGELVRQRMDWLKPMHGTSTVDFTFKSVGDKTSVTWAMYGPQTFVGKAMSLVMSCEKMCGPQFEQGLIDMGNAASLPSTQLTNTPSS